MQKKLSIIINLLVGIFSFGSWIFMAVLGFDGNALTSGGFSSLKYFTVLSNLFNGAVSFVYAMWLIKGSEITVNRKTLKLAATSAVGLTFMTVVAFLAPLYGFRAMFAGSNLWMHLVLPVASMLSFMFLERGCKIPFKYTFCAMLSPIIYSIGYLGNIALNGIGEWPETNDFYLFLAWGNGVGAVIAVTIYIVTWVIALIMYRVGKAYQLQTPRVRGV